jgi:hypothetical protein
MITFTIDQVKYDFNIPSSMSEVNLIINESFEQVHKRMPSETEMGVVYDHLVALAKKADLFK